ncbi:MAG TPA: AI-2E family transporter [Thermoanaerobaculia bacterium]|nr:AI-2E family transporter [Thermoanaerobaculia bacterium]
MTAAEHEGTLGRRFLTAVLLLTTALFLYMIRAFLLPIVLAGVLATLFYPLYKRFVRLFRGRRGLASLACCLIFIVGLLLPLYFVGSLVVRQAVELYQSVDHEIKAMLQGRTPEFLLRLQGQPWYGQLGLDRIDWPATAQALARSSGSFVAGIVSRTSRGTVEAIVAVLITLFTLFYFLLDGERLMRRIRSLSPLSAEHDTALMNRFAAVSRATVRGTFVIGLLQAFLGAMTLWIFGVPSPLFWGVVMLVFAFIPMVGTGFVLIPAAVYQLLTGHIWQGIAILAVSFGVVFTVDNLLRPRLVGRDAGMHDLLIFFSTLGGLATFGAMGFIVGPIIAAFFIALLDIYATEFAHELSRGRGPASGASE